MDVFVGRDRRKAVFVNVHQIGVGREATGNKRRRPVQKFNVQWFKVGFGSYFYASGIPEVS